MNGLSRRKFLAGTVMAAGAVSFSPLSSAGITESESAEKQAEVDNTGLIWGNLIHLSYNMWCDRLPEKWGNYTKEQLHYVAVSDTLRFDDKLWYDITDRMAKAGMNMVVIDVGDAIQYKSCPEISVKNAWSESRLRDELARLRGMGLEPIPKLNFSAGHDQWLHEYSRMVSTPVYYKVCAGVIEEVADLFGKPRFFHLGYDEENFGNQRAYSIAIVRQHELWWHDFDFSRTTVEKQGCRPWIWSDYAWDHPDVFYEKMSRSVLQSNWYYNPDFTKKDEKVLRTFRELEKHGFDQVPTGSNWDSPENFGNLVRWCMNEIPGTRIKGFLQTPWFPTLEPFREKHLEAVDQVGEVILSFRRNQP
jgi:hypothetical protein